MKLKALILILFYLLLYSSATAQKRGEHLEPVRGLFDIYDFQFEYYSKVRKVLFDGLQDSPDIRFQVMDSFFPESVLDIYHDKENEKYYLIYHRTNKKIWSNKVWKSTTVSKYKKEITKSSFDAVKTLFAVAISQTRFTETETRGLDGADYYFSVFDYGLKTGTVWSPTEGTKMDKLVKVGYTLIDFAMDKSKIVQFDEKFLNEIVALEKELRL